MKTLLMLCLATVAIVVNACSNDDVRGTPPDGSLPAMSVTEALKPTSFGRTIRVRGTIAAICQTEGCWMVIADGASRLRMTFQNEDFAMPMDKTGDVLVEGIVREGIYTAEDARMLASSLGKTEAELAPDSSDVRIATMVATGVQFLPGE